MKRSLSLAIVAMTVTGHALAGWGIDRDDSPVQVGMSGRNPTVLIPVSRDQPTGAGNWQVCASLPVNGNNAATMTAAAVTSYDPQTRIITARFDPPLASLDTTDWWIWGVRSNAGMDACKAGFAPANANDWLWIIQIDEFYQMGCRDNPGYRFSFVSGEVSMVTGRPCRN